METNKNHYDKQFYKNNKNGKKCRSVDIVLSEAMKVLPEIRSAVDFGCATGTWLAGLQQHGVTEIKGLDGAWVKKELLIIPPECFVETDFDKEIKLDKKYDLAVSIEVAEHLSEKSAGKFVKALTDASDIILFSAAIPYQGGANHINEQWTDYWNKLFNENGFIAVDCLRKRLWNNLDVLDFHRQNILLYVHKDRLAEVNAPEGDFCVDYPPMSIIDRERYLQMIKTDLSQMSVPRIFIHASKWMLIRMFGKGFCEKIYWRFLRKS